MSFAESWARRRRTSVLLNLDELQSVLAAVGHVDPRRDRSLHSAVCRLDRAEERRRRAVARARR